MYECVLFIVFVPYQINMSAKYFALSLCITKNNNNK